MSQLQRILEALQDTHEAEVISAVDDNYENIQSLQKIWYEKSGFICPDACGECCRNFEPDLLESEALYMAAWLLENQKEVADRICEGEFPFPENKGCPFWDENKAYHCTIYGARPFICRLFGACGNRGKDGTIVFKPCKFYPSEKLGNLNPPLAHKQYSQSEVLNIFSVLPPVMSDLMENAVSITPDNHETKLIREILPETIKKLKWIMQMTNKS